MRKFLIRLIFLGIFILIPFSDVFSGEDVQAKFTDVTFKVGLGKLGPSYGNPIWGDLDNDGFLDIIVPRHVSKPSFYKNNGSGQFMDIFNPTGIIPFRGSDRHGWVLGDYDNDGNLDLHITSGACRGDCIGDKRDELWKGDGQFLFINTATIVGVENSFGRGRSAFWMDYNNDSLLDLFVLNYNTDSILYRNNGNGTFSDVTAEIGLAHISGGNCSWADYNNDDAMDLLITGGENDRLFDNSPPQYTFSDTTSKAGLLPKRGRGIAWGDYNNDGYLDLYISRGNADKQRDSLKWDPTEIIFLDDERLDDGIDFTTSSSQVTFNLYIDNKYQVDKIYIGAGKSNPPHVPFTLIVTDPLLEGSPLYVAGTDTGIFIWRDLSDNWHVRYSSNNKNIIYYGILTTDGSFTGVTPTFKPGKFKFKDTLYRNNGDGTFTDVTDSAGVWKTGNHQVSVWGDYNNDGFLDLYITDAGDISKGEPNILYRNNRNGTFTDVSANQGVDAVTTLDRHLGAAWGDYNNDGFLDLFIKNGVGLKYPLAKGSEILYRNKGNSNHWLKVNLVGTSSNRLGIGSKLTVHINGKIQYWEVNGGGGGELHSQGSGPVHFGLGFATSVDSLVIKWPSGYIQTLTNIPADQIITVIEEE